MSQLGCGFWVTNEKGSLPKSKTVVFPEAGHQMWLQDPELSRNDVEKFLAGFGNCLAALTQRSAPSTSRIVGKLEVTAWKPADQAAELLREVKRL